ncbi:MBL fold metallo-hydrolase [Cerasicoccus frondis]|uniref:MBL fold metallo-hydrolase n=1 Tax=Cerasicoccus frondis TaxID=490090 RepID=UPI002852D45E|nr:MBL fold metallo-hydrolase [Cerasicoccus frondis]
MSGLIYHEIVDKRTGDYDPLKIRFLGTASFIIQNKKRSIVLDPFVSRPSFPRLLFPLNCNAKFIADKFPQANDILIGHSHYDHLMDAPHLCSIRSGSRIIGGRSTALIAEALGVSRDSIIEVTGHETIECGCAQVRPIPSKHAPVIGNKIFFDGYVTKKPTPPLFIWDYKTGEVFDWHIKIDGKQIVHIGSSDFIEEEIEKIETTPIDVVCLCAANWRHRKEEYIRMVIDKLQPKYILPCHWDNIFKPWGKGSRRPSIFFRLGLPNLIERIHAEENVEVILLDFDGVLLL